MSPFAFGSPGLTGTRSTPRLDPAAAPRPEYPVYGL
jgi:hypothetical protein